MRYEIQKHGVRLTKISKLRNNESQVSFTLILSGLKFINEEIIPPEIGLAPETITKEIDIDDIDFVALANV